MLGGSGYNCSPCPNCGENDFWNESKCMSCGYEDQGEEEEEEQ